jgi:hypothetical protein
MAIKDKNKPSDIIIGLSGVIVAVGHGSQQAEPKVFIVRGAEHALSVGVVPTNEEGDALPFGPFDPDHHETPEIGLRRWVAEQTPLHLGYVEQLYTFGNKARYAAQKDHAPRVISIGYLALTSSDKTKTSNDFFFGDWYRYFPWEDWRQQKPTVIADLIEPSLKRWIIAAESKEDKNYRETRVNQCFGLGASEWDEEKVLERYELLYEARLVFEAIRDRGMKVDYPLIPGRSMLYDHRRILATAMGRLRGKLKYRPVVFELVPPEFTLLHLQKTVEAIAGHTLHKQNFRRLVESSGMIEEIKGKKSSEAGGRPAALFRFRREAVAERAPPSKN